MSSIEQLHRPYPRMSEGEQPHSPFLTDRETAELTAMATMGPLALAAFDMRPTPSMPEQFVPPEVPDTIDETVDGFSTQELITAIHRQQNVARAALLFAAREMN